uniref:Uncharacterized protein n=1 Tax=Heterorhabditis bacteriophora TaxID=37862 RepID=A0A1I7X2R4_HETBA
MVDRRRVLDTATTTPKNNLENDVPTVVQRALLYCLRYRGRRDCRPTPVAPQKDAHLANITTGMCPLCMSRDPIDWTEDKQQFVFDRVQMRGELYLRYSERYGDK